MLAGLMSLWMIPKEWRCRMPRRLSIQLFMTSVETLSPSKKKVFLLYCLGITISMNVWPYFAQHRPIIQSSSTLQPWYWAMFGWGWLLRRSQIPSQALSIWCDLGNRGCNSTSRAVWCTGWHFSTGLLWQMNSRISGKRLLRESSSDCTSCRPWYLSLRYIGFSRILDRFGHYEGRWHECLKFDWVAGSSKSSRNWITSIAK